MDMKTITISNRDLVRRYRFYRDQLLSGEVEKIIIPVNGKSIFVGVEKTKKTQPGDIRPLLEKLSTMKKPYRIKRIAFRTDRKYP